MHSTPIELIDNVNQGRRVGAVLVENPNDDFIEATDNLWRIYRKRFVDALKDSGKPIPDHDHWSWKWKIQQELNRDSLFKCYAIVADEEPQGLTLLNYGRECQSRLPEQKGRLLVYVAYVEAAPWNVEGYTEKRRYRGVGKALYKAAVGCSSKMGFQGLVGLHSLPNVEGFYENACEMISFGPDPNYGNLVYFESLPIIKSPNRKIS